MPDTVMFHALPQRLSPLSVHVRHGRYGAVHLGDPGVRFSIRHPLSMVAIIARTGQEAELAVAVSKKLGVDLPAAGHWHQKNDLSIVWSGPSQYMVITSARSEGQLYQELRQALQGLVSVIDQSHGRVMLRIEGPKARALLAKGTSVDLHSRAFGPGRVAMTQMAHIGVHLAQISPDIFDLSLFRSFSEHFWVWLTKQAEELGYEITS